MISWQNLWCPKYIPWALLKSTMKKVVEKQKQLLEKYTRPVLINAVLATIKVSLKPHTSRSTSDEVGLSILGRKANIIIHKKLTWNHNKSIEKLNLSIKPFSMAQWILPHQNGVQSLYQKILLNMQTPHFFLSEFPISHAMNLFWHVLINSYIILNEVRCFTRQSKSHSKAILRQNRPKISHIYQTGSNIHRPYQSYKLHTPHENHVIMKSSGNQYSTL